MRKILFVMFAALAFVACEKDFQSQTEKTELEIVVQNNKVSLKQALLYAENSVNGINPTTRSTERKVKSTEIYVAKPATRSTEDTEVSFYLINYEDNEGFAMVSTDSRATPVYAYSDSGNLTPEDFETNPGLQIFLEGSIENYQIEIASIDDNDRLPIERPDSTLGNLLMPMVEYNGGTYYLGLTTEDIVKNPLLTTYWEQGSPYGSNCPGGIAGCGPIAAAQIMAYHKHPAQHYGHTFNWDAMTATPTLSPGSTGAIEAAQLIYLIGDAAGIEYPGETGVDIRRLRNTIWFFNYNCAELPDDESSNYDIDRVVENIDDELPVLMSGFPESGPGHAWVIDGYERRNAIYTYYYLDAPTIVYDTRVATIATYFHCNLGWGPYHSNQTYAGGYFHSSSFLYNNRLSAVYDITPR